MACLLTFGEDIAVSEAKTPPPSTTNETELAVKIQKAADRFENSYKRAYETAGLDWGRGPAPQIVLTPPPKPPLKVLKQIDKARKAAIEEMGALGPEAAPLLLRAKEISLAGGGVIYIQALIKIGKPAVPTLLDAFDDPDHSVRYRAVVSVGIVDKDQAVDRAIDLLKQKEQKKIAYGVEAFFCLRNSKKAVEPLLHVWNQGILRDLVVLALVAQNEKQAFQPLMTMTEEWLSEAEKTGDWNRKDRVFSYIRALNQMGDPRAIPLLKKLLKAGPQYYKDGEDYSVAEAAAEALRKFGYRVEGDRIKGGYRILAEPGKTKEKNSSADPIPDNS
ncbi:MAG: HEAT repeat domain-containing protein [Pirellulales bacterium]|nr:HEAT repeat domain-containing protein [Pirellulales bacterium]